MQSQHAINKMKTEKPWEQDYHGGYKILVGLGERCSKNIITQFWTTDFGGLEQYRLEYSSKVR
jgi:hypothetical protein